MSTVEVKRITKNRLKQRQEAISFIDSYGTSGNTKGRHIIEVLDENQEPDFFMNNLEKIIGGLFLILFLGGLYVK